MFCRDIPTSETAQLKDCCAAHENTAQRFAAAAQQAPNVPRPDLEAGPKGLAYDWQYKRCTKLRYAEVPAFTQDEYGVTRVRRRRGRGWLPQRGRRSGSACPLQPSTSPRPFRHLMPPPGPWNPRVPTHTCPLPSPRHFQTTQARIESQPVPDLTPDQIRAVKRAALAQAPPAIAANISALLARADAARGPAGRFSGLRHPAGYAGAGELAIATARLAAGLPLQAAAIDSLVTVGAQNLANAFVPPPSCPSTSRPAVARRTRGPAPPPLPRLLR